MMRVLTEEEHEQSQKRDYAATNHWWESLPLRERMLIYNHYKEILKQRLCEHKWREVKFYSKTVTQCSECDLTLDGSSKRSVITEKSGG